MTLGFPQIVTFFCQIVKERVLLQTSAFYINVYHKMYRF